MQFTKKKLDELVSEAKEGKPLAQHYILEWLWDDIYFYVLSKIRKKNEAEDITIKTFTKVFSKFDLYNEDFDFKTWVRAIAHNTLIDFVRVDRSISMTGIDTYQNELALADPTPEEAFINKQGSEKIKEIILNMSPKYGQVLALRYLEDKSYKEISKELDVTLSNVKVRIMRAKKILAELVENPIDHE